MPKEPKLPSRKPTVSEPPTILAADIKVGDKLLSYGTVTRIELMRVAHFDTHAVLTLWKDDQPYVKG